MQVKRLQQVIPVRLRQLRPISLLVVSHTVGPLVDRSLILGGGETWIVVSLSLIVKSEFLQALFKDFLSD